MLPTKYICINVEGNFANFAPESGKVTLNQSDISCSKIEDHLRAILKYCRENRRHSLLSDRDLQPILELYEHLLTPETHIECYRKMFGFCNSILAVTPLCLLNADQSSLINPDLSRRICSAFVKALTVRTEYIANISIAIYNFGRHSSLARVLIFEHFAGEALLSIAGDHLTSPRESEEIFGAIQQLAESSKEARTKFQELRAFEIMTQLMDDELISPVCKKFVIKTINSLFD